MKKDKKRNYWRETYRNKIFAIAYIGLSVLGVKTLGEWNMVICTSIIAIPLFFTKKKII